MKKIADDVYKYSGEGNVYVVLKPTPLVIDSSRSADKEKVRKAIEKIIPLKDISIVVFTHLHYDHAGNFDLFPSAKFYASAEELNDFKVKPFGAVLNFSLARKLSDVRFLPLGKEFNGLKVISCPGHTRGSISLFDASKKILFSGDTLFFNELYGRTDMPTSVPEKMRSTLEMLKKFEYKILCPGHDYE